MNLEIDRSFSQYSSFLALKALRYANGKAAPLVTSLFGFAAPGIALSLSLAGFMAPSLFLGYLLGKGDNTNLSGAGSIVLLTIMFLAISTIFHCLCILINKGFIFAAVIIETSLNIITCLLSGIIGLATAVIGLVPGLVVGAFASLQLLWTDNSITFPLRFICKAAMNTGCLEMDSVSEMKKLTELTKKSNIAPKITVENSLDDDTTPVDASLNAGLRAVPHQKPKKIISDLACFILV